jgi:hypothetical protein
VRTTQYCKHDRQRQQFDEIRLSARLSAACIHDNGEDKQPEQNVSLRSVTRMPGLVINKPTKGVLDLAMVTGSLLLDGTNLAP